MDKRPLVIITGPTGVGKTDISIDLAKKINGEIISADSIQIYKYMDVGSAKIMPEEMDGVPHHLVDELYPDQEFNVFVFKEMAKKAIEGIYERNRIPVIVGGTGFYIQSILYDIDFSDEDNEQGTIRKKYMDLAAEHGNDYLHDMLRRVDPESAELIHKNNVKRVIRALEFFEINGKKISEHNEEQKQNESPYNFEYFVLNRERSILYDRIEKRVDIMLEDGLENEVRELLDKGFDRKLVSMQGLGYKEMAAYIEGEISLEEAVYLIKRDTRRFAKRQLTWFRREKTVRLLNYEDFDNSKSKMCEFMIECLKKRGIV